MTLEFISGVGSDSADFRLNLVATSAKDAPGVTFPVETADAPPVAAPDGDRWIAFDDTAGNFILSGSTTTITPKTYQWMCENAWRLRGTLGAGHTGTIVGFTTDFGGATLTWAQVTDDSSFKIKWGGIESASTFSVDTSYDWRMQFDGSRFVLYVDGNEEINRPYAARITFNGITLHAPDNATQIHYHNRIILCQSASISDRPDTAAEMQMLEPDTVAGMYEQNWGDDADCNPGEVTAASTDVDLDGAAQVETTNFWCENAGDGDDCTSEMEDTGAFAGTILAVVFYAVVRASLGGKICNFDFRLHNGVDLSEQAGTALADDTWRGQARTFTDPLTSGNAWEDEIDDLKAGAATTALNTANPQLAGFIVKVFAIGSDPPGVEEPGVSPLVGVGLGSANPGVY